MSTATLTTEQVVGKMFFDLLQRLMQEKGLRHQTVNGGISLAAEVERFAINASLIDKVHPSAITIAASLFRNAAARSLNGLALLNGNSPLEDEVIQTACETVACQMLSKRGNMWTVYLYNQTLYLSIYIGPSGAVDSLFLVHEAPHILGKLLPVHRDMAAIVDQAKHLLNLE